MVIDSLQNQAIRMFLQGCVTSMMTGAPACLTDMATELKVVGQVNSVEREDGSGKLFNVSFVDGRKHFFRFKDSGFNG